VTRSRAAGVAAILTLGLCASGIWMPLAAQVTTRPAAPGQKTAAPAPASKTSDAEPTAPGWTITPSLGVSSTWDDNPTLASDGADARVSDYVTAVRPDVNANYRGRLTSFSAGYGGIFDFYRDLPDLNTQDHRGSIDFTQQVSRRVSIFARDQAIYSPTTGDLTDLVATVLRRRTTTMNSFRTGFDAVLARHTTLTAAYATQWIDFETAANDPSTAFLQGGHSHGGSGSLRQQISPRVAIGADYTVQRALAGETADLFDTHSVLAVSEVALARHVEASFGYGHSWLFTGDGQRRNGPAFRLGLQWHGRRAVGRITYARAFLPSFGFGGTYQNEELRANLSVPVGRWFSWNGGGGATHSDPLTFGTPELRAYSAQTSIAVTVKRRLRLEAFGSRVFQDSKGAGGRLHVTRLGVQASIATPVRAR
jgi:hypothetical protein